MGGIHIRVAYPQRCVVLFLAPVFVFAGLWTQEKRPPWEQERRAPVRARGAEDGGGAPGPSTVKGEMRNG